MPMGNSWAWPTSQVSMEQTKDAMVVVGRRVAQEAGEYRGSGHPLEITHDLAVRYAAMAEEVVRAGRPGRVDAAAGQLVAASPTEAAIHDAYGKALGENSYNLLGPEFVHRDLGGIFGRGVRRRISRSLHVAAAEIPHAALSPDRRPRPADGRRPGPTRSTTACRKPCPNGSPPTG